MESRQKRIKTSGGYRAYYPMMRYGRKSSSSRKKYSRRSGKYRKSGFYGRFNGPRGIGKPELKFFDTSMASTAVDNTLEVQGNLNLIPQVGVLLLSAIKPVTLV